MPRVSLLGQCLRHALYSCIHLFASIKSLIIQDIHNYTTPLSIVVPAYDRIYSVVGRFKLHFQSKAIAVGALLIAHRKALYKSLVALRYTAFENFKLSVASSIDDRNLLFSKL